MRAQEWIETSQPSGMSGPAPVAPYGPMAPPMMPMETPDTGRIKTGLLLGGIGILINAFVGFVGFGFIGWLLTFIGVLLVWTGTKSYPQARGMAMAGMGLLLVGFVLSIVAWSVTPALFTAFGGTQAELQNILNAWALSLLLTFIAGLLAWVGILLAPLKLVTGSSKGLLIAGGVLGILGVVIVFGMVYLTVGTILSALSGTAPDLDALASQLITALFGLIIGGLMGLIGGILAGVAYIIGRGKLVAPGAAPM